MLRPSMIAVASLVVACASPARITLPHDEGAPGAVELRLPVYGTATHFAPGRTTARFLGSSSIEVTHIEVHDEKRLDVFINIPFGEPPGARLLEVSTGIEVATAPFRVTGWPTISASPGTVQQGAIGVAVSLTGDDTHFTRPGFSVESSSGGVVVRSVDVVDDQEANLIVDVAVDAVPEALPRGLLVTTDHQLLHVPLRITRRSEEPAVQVSPAQGDLGTEVVVTIDAVGTVFPPDAEAAFPETVGLEVVDLVRLSDTELEATLWLYSDGPSGAHSLHVLTEAGWLVTPFETAVPNDLPTLTLSDPELLQDSFSMLLATGSGTHFSADQTTVRAEPSNAGVFFTIGGVPGPEQLQVQAQVAPDAAVGVVHMVVETGPERILAPMLIKAKGPKPKVSLDPSVGRQGRTIPVRVTLENSTWDPATIVEPESGGGITATNVVVDSATLLRMDLVIQETATVGTQHIRFHSGSETIRGKFRVQEGFAEVILTPDQLPQDTENATVVATGSFLEFAANPTVEARDGCRVTVVVTQAAPDELILDVTVPFTQPVGACTLRFETTDGHVDVVLTITEGVPTIPVPGTVNGRVSDDTFFHLALAAADVVRARVTRAIGSPIDPVLELYDGDGILVAEDDDESAATYGSLIVYQAREAGSYFLHVRDRFGFNDGDFTIDLDWYAPENALEIDPITDTDKNINRPRATPIGSAGASVLVRGRFQKQSDWFDYYRVGATPGQRLAVSILAQDVSPYATSTADIQLRLFQGMNGPSADEATLGLEGPDPVLYLTPSGSEFFIRARREPGSLPRTTYWLNVRPWVIINEVLHDEGNGWDASFVELHGEPGAALTGCRLVGRTFDGVAVATAFDVDISAGSISGQPNFLGPWGYFVAAHDTLVPGTGADFIYPALSIDDPNGDFTSIGIQLECAGAILDTVCYRGTDVPGCEGPAAVDLSGVAIGRGFKVDTDDNAADFLIQPEQSPWASNLREVR